MKTTKKKVPTWSGEKHAKSVVREHARHAYGSKSTALLSPKAKSFASADVIQRVAKGLPFSELEMLRSEIDEPLDSLARRLSISRSTLQRRRTEHRLSPQESDRVMRFWRCRARAAMAEISATRARRGCSARLREHRSGRARSRKSSGANRLRRLLLMPSGWRIVRG